MTTSGLFRRYDTTARDKVVHNRASRVAKGLQDYAVRRYLSAQLTRICRYSTWKLRIDELGTKEASGQCDCCAHATFLAVTRTS